jgi:hypothetical protein
MEEWERRMLAWLEQRRSRILQEEEEAGELLEHYWRRHRRELSRIELVFKLHHPDKGEHAMAPTTGPVTLTAAGQVATASVLGFDQDGKPMPEGFQMPPVSYADDNPAAAATVGNADGETAEVTAMGNGVDTVTASLVSAEGLQLSDTQAVTVDIAPPPPPPPPPPPSTPVLTSIKLAFDVQVPAAEAPAATEEPEAAAEGDDSATTAAAPAPELTPNQKIAGTIATQTGPQVTEIDPNLEPAKNATT